MRTSERVAETSWKVVRYRVIGPYAKPETGPRVYPEYHRTRDIRWEAGRTIFQP